MVKMASCRHGFALKLSILFVGLLFNIT